MKKQKSALFTIALVLLAGLTSEVQALPMFGKQTGLDCTACHLQHMPKLNSVGRKFAASGMTQSKKVDDANGSGMDINPSVMLRAMYEETWNLPNSSGAIKDTPTIDGEWYVPKTVSLFLGGKVSENVGGIVSASSKDAEDDTVGGKIVYAKEVKGGYLGAVAYSAANFGPFSGMESYNSGLYRPLKTFDMRKLSNAFQISEIGTGDATGVQIYYDRDTLLFDGDHLFTTAGVYAPAQDNVDMNLASNQLPFARIAYEFPIGNFNLIVGGFGISGGSTVSASDPLHVERETYGMDIQLEGEVAQKSVSFIMSNVFKNKVTYTGHGSNLVDPEEYTNMDNDAFSMEGEINFLPEFGIKAAYMTFNDRYDYPNSIHKPTSPNSDYSEKHVNVKDIDRAFTVGFDYSFEVYLPMKLSVEHTWALPYLDRVEDYRDLLVTLNILY